MISQERKSKRDGKSGQEREKREKERERKRKRDGQFVKLCSDGGPYKDLI